LSSQNSYQAHEYLYQLDHISKTVCNVIDAAELCRSVHASEEWRESANRAFAMISEYIGELNADTTLYETLRKVTEHTDQVRPNLSEEDERFCQLLRAEFERDGIHLPQQERQELQQLQMHVTQLETMFNNNLVQSRKDMNIDRAALDGVFHPQYLASQGISEDMATLKIPTESDIAQTLSKYSANPEVRRHVYMESMTAYPENLPVLEALINMRHQVSTKLGFDSYADRFLQDKMAGSQANVYSFLNNLLQSNQPAYKAEMEEILQAKQKVEGVSPVSAVIEPWDIPFYTGILKARKGFDAGAVSAYLTLDNCIDGIKILVDRLFGIQMIEKEVAPDEAWDRTSSEQQTALRRLEFVDQTTGESLGTMYLDLQKREGKYGHAAHFTVRCGCVEDSPYAENATGAFQKPIIALVCNLSNLSHGGSSILSHNEVETIYHEMGHMLHSMLSRTKYQHLSGTRAPMDFVETPSHWLENFVWDSEFLQILGRHHETGSPIPDDMVEKLQQSRYEYHAIERQNQILYALFDQKIFGVPDHFVGIQGRVNSTDIFAKLHRKQGVPYADGTHWHSRFGHLITYGAGYYGYLYSQVFARDIWKECFEGNSMSRTAGEKIWHNVLIHGGARDPNIMLKELLGRSPRVD